MLRRVTEYELWEHICKHKDGHTHIAYKFQGSYEKSVRVLSKDWLSLDATTSSGLCLGHFFFRVPYLFGIVSLKSTKKILTELVF